MRVFVLWFVAAVPSLILPLQLLLWWSYHVISWIHQRNGGHLVVVVVPAIVENFFFGIVPGAGFLRAAFHCFDGLLWQIFCGKILLMLFESLLIFEHENKLLSFFGGDSDQLISNFCHVCCSVYCFHLVVVVAGLEINVDKRILEKQVFYFCNIAT